MSRPRSKPPARFIYVIGPERGLQKVGLAIDPQVRLSALQTASPFALIVHASVAVPFRAAHAVERRAHQILARYRVRREWFQVAPADAVAAIHEACAPLTGMKTLPSDPAVKWPPVSSWQISRASAGRPKSSLITASAMGQEGAADGLPLFECTRPVASPGFDSNSPLGTLTKFRLDISCCGPITSYPVGLLASSLPRGGRTPLSAALGLFQCDRCSRPAREALLVDLQAGAEWRLHNTNQT